MSSGWHQNLYKKLKLVDGEEIQRLIEKGFKTYNPELRAMSELKMDMNEILNSKDLSAEEKIALLQANKLRFDEHRQRIQFTPAPISASIPSHSTLPSSFNANLPPASAAATSSPTPVATTPITKINTAQQDTQSATTSLKSEATTHLPMPPVKPAYDNKIETLRQLLDSSQDAIARDSQTGEIILDGEPITGSSFHDLVQSLYSPVKKANLIGQNEFIQVLSRLMSPGGKWENVRPSQIIPRYSFYPLIKSKSTPHKVVSRSGFHGGPLKTKISMKGKGLKRHVSRVSRNPPPGRKVNVLHLY